MKPVICQKTTISEQLKVIIQSLGDDPNREGLMKTPERAAQALQYLTTGYQENLSSIVNGALFTSDMDEMVIVRNIEWYSLCEHHLLPFFGKCHVGYVPDGKILGLSKVARIINMFAKRLQVQEQLTKQIADALQSVTQARGVGVILEAQHLCMMMRGVEKQASCMTTSVMLGLFRSHPQTRNEFLTLVR